MNQDQQEKTEPENNNVFDIDKIIEKLLSVRRESPGKLVKLEESEILYLIYTAKDIFMEQPIFLELSAPLKVCGDIHGQYYDLLRLFEYGNYPPKSNYLFLGDYVDRGKQNLETICLLLSYKIKYPLNFFMLRGNHESDQINRIYGFYEECKRRYNVKMWKIFADCFNCLPVAALIEDKILCMHGGLSPDLISLDQIRKIQRPTFIPDNGVLCDLLWSDPDREVSGWGENERGVSYVFGADIIKAFLNSQDLDLICRAHQVVEDGYEFFANKKLVTVFSAPNYCDEFDNSAGIMIVNENLVCSFKILQPAEKKALEFRQDQLINIQIKFKLFVMSQKDYENKEDKTNQEKENIHINDMPNEVQTYVKTLGEGQQKKYIFLYNKNQKLREELKQISAATENLLQKERTKKNQYRQKQKNVETNSEIKEKKKKLQEQQKEISQLKNQIKKQKNELESTYHYEIIREKEDELNNLKRIYKELKSEKQTIAKITKEQEKALNLLKEDKKELLRKNNLVQKLNEMKQKQRELLDEKNKLEKDVNYQHNQLINSKLELRNKQQKIEMLKKKKGAEISQITENDVKDLENQIEQLKELKDKIFKENENKLKFYEKNKKELQKENQRLEKIIKEKDKEIRLNSLKLKELRKLQRHNLLKPMNKNEQIQNGNDNNKSQVQNDNIQKTSNDNNPVKKKISNNSRPF